LTTIGVREPRRRDIVPLTQISVGIGQTGFVKYDIEVKEIKQEHSICFFLKVLQPSGRTDLDIGFSLMDNENYERWRIGQPSSAFTIVPRFNFGTVIFSPQVTGIYHAVLDNRYSILTVKEVMLNIYETWIEERKVKVPVQKEEKKIEPKVGRLRRCWNRICSSKPLGFLSLFVVVQLICLILVIGAAYLLHYTLGVEYGDILGYITTAIGGSAVILLIYLYFILTGRSIVPLPSQG
jgi:hypothetical protein